MLTLEETKRYLKIDHDREDARIRRLILLALSATADYLNRPMVKFATTGPVLVNAALLLLVADLYDQRDAPLKPKPFENSAYEHFLKPYRCAEPQDCADTSNRALAGFIVFP